jgi:hypothetical protein
MKTPVLLLFICMLAVRSFGQFRECPPRPDYNRWKDAMDYEESRDSVEDLLRWLVSTPLAIRPKDRSEANVCVMIWLAGSPQVTISVLTEALPFLEEYSDLLFPVVHGMALYKMKHPKECNEVRLHSEGLKALAGLIEQSELLSKDKSFRPLLRAYRRNEMEAYVTGELARTGDN